MYNWIGIRWVNQVIRQKKWYEYRQNMRMLGHDNSVKGCLIMSTDKCGCIFTKF